MAASSAPALELLHRARATRAEVEDGGALEELARSKRLSVAQATSLSATIAGFVETTKLAEKSLEDAGDDAASRYVQLEAELLKLEQARLLVQAIVDQRRVDATLLALQVADACALAGYARIVGPGEEPSVSRAPPIVVLEPSNAPAMTPPRESVFAPGFLRATKVPVTVPLIYLPPSYLRSLGQLTTLQHEVGHLCDHHHGLSDTFGRALERVVPGSDWDNLGPKQRRQRWTSWMSEMVADVVGCVLAGPAFAMTLASILTARGAVGSWSLANATLYPPESLRLHLVRCALEQLGVEASSLGAAVEPPVAAATPFFADARSIVGMLLDEPVQSLPGGSLRALADTRSEVGQTAALATDLVKDRAVDARISVRLLPGAVQLASMDAPVELAAIHRAALERASQLEAPSWVMSNRELRSLQELTKVQPTVHDASDERVKSPPLVLLTQHDRVAFVGATHWQLVDRLKEARAKRDRPWVALEVFFLAEAELAQFASLQTPEARMLERNREERKKLEALLVEKRAPFVSSWSIYEYAQPKFFASFWDWDEPRGRIHVSPAVWGLDLSTCPGHDFVRGIAPSYAYSAYLEGLGHLRSISSLIASGPRGT